MFTHATDFEDMTAITIHLQFYVPVKHGLPFHTVCLQFRCSKPPSDVYQPTTNQFQRTLEEKPVLESTSFVLKLSVG